MLWCLSIGRHNDRANVVFLQTIPTPLLRSHMFAVTRRGIRWLGLPWWRHQMETFSAILAHCEGNPPVTGRFSSQRPVTRTFDVVFDLRQNKRLNKQSRRRWFETPSRSLWRYCNDCGLTLPMPQYSHNRYSLLKLSKRLPFPFAILVFSDNVHWPASGTCVIREVVCFAKAHKWIYRIWSIWTGWAENSA